MNAKRRTVKTLAVDGTRDVVADGQPAKMHAIVRERDFTHNRIAGYAKTMEHAVVFAASLELLDALEATETLLAAIPSVQMMRPVQAALIAARAAIAKARAKP